VNSWRNSNLSAIRGVGLENSLEGLRSDLSIHSGGSAEGESESRVSPEDVTGLKVTVNKNTRSVE